MYTWIFTRSISQFVIIFLYNGTGVFLDLELREKLFFIRENHRGLKVISHQRIVKAKTTSLVVGAIHFMCIQLSHQVTA